MAGFALVLMLVVTAVAADPPQADRIAALIEQLGDTKFRVREAAMRGLIALGRPAIPALRQALKSGDLEVRMRARMVLDKIQTGMAFLIDELKEGNADERRHALETLARMGAEAKAAVPELVKLLKHKDETVRELALSAVLAIDPDNKAIGDTALARASVNGKYARLLRRIHVPQDRQTYMDFRDYGQYQATDYAGHANIPAGYWVYVYPHWYIWGELKPGR